MSRWLIGLGSLVFVSGFLYRYVASQRALRAKEHQDRKLDEALMESFPASDPR